MTMATETATHSLADGIRAAVKRGELCLPPLPELATRVLDLLRDDEDADSKRVAELVRNDQAVAATLLRMANSAAFGGLREVTELSQAITRVGLRQVSSVLTALLHKGNFETANPARLSLFRSLWDHALATAIAAKFLTSAGGGDPEEAFLSGLLHDTGKLVVLKAADELHRREPGTVLTDSVVEELTDALHAELGHSTLLRWKLPQPVCRVALHHHDEPASGDLLLMRVQAADAISRKIGAHPHPDPDLNLLEVPAVERLNLSDLDVATLLVDLEDAITAIKQLL